MSGEAKPTKRKPEKKPRAHRKDAADNIAGIREHNGSWSLPSFTIESWFIARAIPGARRGGFRAWARDRDEGRIKSRHPVEWDKLYDEFRRAPA